MSPEDQEELNRSVKDAVESFMKKRTEEFNARFDNGYVYAIERADGWVKIGKTRDPKSRIRSISMQGGFDPVNVYITEHLHDSAFVERAAHFDLQRYRTIGEWFNVSFSSVCRSIESACYAMDHVKCVIKSVDSRKEEMTRSLKRLIEEMRKSVLDDMDHPFYFCCRPIAQRVLSQEFARFSDELINAALEIRQLLDISKEDEDRAEL